MGFSLENNAPCKLTKLMATMGDFFFLLKNVMIHKGEDGNMGENFMIRKIKICLRIFWNW
jgi:hypothetical protein